jgi:hypothetical protein
MDANITACLDTEQVIVNEGIENQNALQNKQAEKLTRTFGTQTSFGTQVNNPIIIVDADYTDSQGDFVAFITYVMNVCADTNSKTERMKIIMYAAVRYLKLSKVNEAELFLKLQQTEDIVSS